MENVLNNNLRPAFNNNNEADIIFIMFNKDINSDISIKELKAIYIEVGCERKAIIIFLKDLNSVILKLDNVFLFIIIVIIILVLILLILISAFNVLTLAKSTVLALS